MMRSYIEANKSEIGHLLNKGDEQLLIPIYQRDFVWKAKNGEDFLNDLLAQEDTKLFLGTFVFRQEKESKQIEIVDGQQRITTILIFLIACRVSARSNGCSEKLINAIQNHIILGFYEERSRLKTKSTDNITQPFRIMCQSDWSGQWTEEMKNAKGWETIEKPYKFFMRKIKDCIGGDDDQENIIFNLLQKILNIEYIEITVKGAREAIDTFERVNARGQKLRTHELIKAFLFSKSLNDQELSDFIEDKWKKINEYDSNSIFNLDNVLFYFYFSQKGYTQKANLYRELREFTDADPKIFIEKLESFAHFCSIFTSVKGGLSDSDLVRYLNKDDIQLGNTSITNDDNKTRITRSIFAIGLSKIQPVYSLIYASLISLSSSIQHYGNDKNKIGEWISFLEFLEDYYFVVASIMHRTSQYGGNLQDFNTKYCNRFNQEQDDFIDIIQDAKTNLQSIMSIDRAAFEASFLDLRYTNDIGIIHYIFDRLNNTVKGTRERVKPTEYLSTASMQNYTLRSNSVEHILPQSGNYREDLESAKHNMGNLLIVHRNHNSSLSDKPPDEKVRQLQGWLDDGTIKNRVYIQEFIDYYNEIKAQGREWDEKAIEERGRRLAQRMYDITYYKEKK